MTTFQSYARVYDLLYRDKDYAAESRYVLSLCGSRAGDASRILDLGCGTGAHAEQFARLGHSVLGVDQSVEMLTEAERRRQAMSDRLGRRLAFKAGNLRDLDLGQRFDFATGLFHVMSYQAGEGDLEAAFAAVARHLDAGGLFIFDFWHGPGVLADPPGVRERQAEDEVLGVRRIARPKLDAARNRVDVAFSLEINDRRSGRVSTVRETHAMRYFFVPELVELLSKQGMATRTIRGWMSDAEPTPADWYACMVAERQK